jgi:hypothetical protein
MLFENVPTEKVKLFLFYCPLIQSIIFRYMKILTSSHVIIINYSFTCFFALFILQITGIVRETSFSHFMSNYPQQFFIL